MSLLEILKVKTQPLHDRIEQSLNLFERVRTPHDHLAILEKHYGFLKPIEFRLAQIPEVVSVFDFEQRLKIPMLLKDFEYFELRESQIAQIPICPLTQLSAPFDLSVAVGVLYVLEGSTLGGRIITEQFSQRLGLTAQQGLRFYASYGDQLGPMWRNFRAGVEMLDHKEALASETTVNSAISTFEILIEWMKAKTV
jgi:heme oxygenase